MGAFGSLAPSPRRVGGAPSRVKTILDAINAGMGTAYDTTPDSPVYLQSLAIARLVAALYSANERLKNQFDPLRTTDFLSRWERVFGLTPSTHDSAQARRGRLAAAWRALGGPVYGTLQDMCSSLLGSIYASVDYTPVADAVVHWPGGGEPGAWYSSVAHVVVTVTQPGTVLDPEWFLRLRQCGAALSLALPAWTTWTFVKDGPNGRGFYLDESRNLNFQAFAA